MSYQTKPKINLGVLIMTKLNILLLFTCILINGCKTDDGWIYDGNLHEIILQSDRIVVRDGGIGTPQSIDKDTVLYDTKDAYDLNFFLKNFLT